MCRNRRALAVLPLISFLSGCVTVNMPASNTSDAYESPMQRFRRSMDETRNLAVAIESHMVDYASNPKVGETSLRIGPHSLCDISALAEALATYRPHLQPLDPYGRPYLYWLSPDGRHYAVLCLGAEGKLRHESEVEALLTALTVRGLVLKRINIACFQDPVLFADGEFLTFPEGDVRTCP